MFKSLQNIVKIPELRRKLLVTFGFLIAYRLGRYITLPGVDAKKIDELTQSGGGFGDLLNFASMITGGSLSQCTLFALGIMPYISASIIFSLLVKVIPQLEALSKEGESGRRKITQYTRYSTVVLCVVQSMFIISWMKTGNLTVEAEPGFGFWLTTVLALTTGTVLLMWIGEMITEFGIGNGISLIIMAGIIAAMPGAFFQMYKNIEAEAQTGGNVPIEVMRLLAFVGLFVAVVIAVVVMQQGQRRIPVQQAKHTRGRRVYGGPRHFLPLRVNAAGVMPVIFAQSLIILPSALFSRLGLTFFNNIFQKSDSFWYLTIYIALNIFFSYFWVSLMFNPVEMATNMKEYGSFIPGIRPGKRTAEYLERIMNRVTLVGACFLAAIAIFPIVVSSTMGISMMLATFLGGTGILIVVGVALDVVQKVESHLLMRHYEGFMRTGRLRGRRMG